MQGREERWDRGWEAGIARSSGRLSSGGRCGGAEAAFWRQKVACSWVLLFVCRAEVGGREGWRGMSLPAVEMI